MPTSAPAAMGAELILTDPSSFFSPTHKGAGPRLLLTPYSFSQGAQEMQEIRGSCGGKVGCAWQW